MKKRIEELRWVEGIIKVMDKSFKVPGTNIQFGLDPIIGLFPVVGEAITFVISALILVALVRNGISTTLFLQMLGNIFIDYLIGNIPLVGDIFDFYFKANSRNYSLLKKYYESGEISENKNFIWVALIIIFLVVVLCILFIGLMLNLIFSLFN